MFLASTWFATRSSRCDVLPHSFTLVPHVVLHALLCGRPIAGLISTWLPWLPIVAVHRSKDPVIQEEWDAGDAHE